MRIKPTKLFSLLWLTSLFCVLTVGVYFIALFLPNKVSSNNASINKSPNSIESISPEQLQQQTIDPFTQAPLETEPAVPETEIHKEYSFQDHLALQAELRLQSDVTYDGSYHKIAYPMGDVPPNIGVCTDVVVRSYRGLGIDLQERVHKDMKRHFKKYPQKWNLSRPDTNIDHRRVLNLMTYFERSGVSLELSNDSFDYLPGNIVTWDLGKGLYHIGIVSNYVSEITGNPLIIHNIGAGIEMNDILFKYRILGHYQYGELLKH